MCDIEMDCACREAVTRAYGELKGKRVSNVDAFDTAVMVFRFHHPEISPVEADYTVAEWIGEQE